MLKTGQNEIDGVTVKVVRKRIRCINIRVGEDGVVGVSVPKWYATLAEAEAFLKSKWKWVLKARAAVLARPSARRMPPTDAELAALKRLLAELNAAWAARLGETDVAWRVRAVKTVWGTCNWRKRLVSFNAELAGAPRELVEYVVVHEYTHFKVHDHGPRFYSLMDERLPGWKVLRRRLNARDWSAVPAADVPPSAPAHPVQMTFWAE